MADLMAGNTVKKSANIKQIYAISMSVCVRGGGHDERVTSYEGGRGGEVIYVILYCVLQWVTGLWWIIVFMGYTGCQSKLSQGTQTDRISQILNPKM